MGSVKPRSSLNFCIVIGSTAFSSPANREDATSPGIPWTIKNKIVPRKNRVGGNRSSLLSMYCCISFTYSLDPCLLLRLVANSDVKPQSLCQSGWLRLTLGLRFNFEIFLFVHPGIHKSRLNKFSSGNGINISDVILFNLEFIRSSNWNFRHPLFPHYRVHLCC